MTTTLRGRATEADVRVGRLVKAISDLLGIEQQDLAARAGMSPQALNGKIKGRSPWRLSEMDAVADALGVTREALQRDPDAILVQIGKANDGEIANLSLERFTPLAA